MNNKEKVLIIGGSGFIGHNLAIKLSKKFKIYIVDSFTINNLKSFKVRTNNLENSFYIKILKERVNLLKKNKINIII